MVLDTGLPEPLEFPTPGGQHNEFDQSQMFCLLAVGEKDDVQTRSSNAVGQA